MSWKKVSIIFFVFFVIGVINISAQEPFCEPTIESCDYTAIESDDYQNEIYYIDPNFYVDSDPYYWKWDLVDWEMVDLSREELYGLEEFYTKLPEGYYYDLDYDLIDYYAKDLDYSALDYTQVQYDVADQTRIDAQKYFKDLGCSQCIFQESESGLVAYDSNGISHVNARDFVSIPGTYPTGTLFLVEAYSITIMLPKEITSITIPETDRVTLEIKEEQEISLENGATMTAGRVNLYGGRIYVPSGDEVTINDIFIRNVEFGPPIEMYFDGKTHEGIYISMDKEEGWLFLDTADSEYGLSFLPGNAFFDVEENDFLIVYPIGTTMSIEKREGFIPLVTAEGQELKVLNGPDEYFFATDFKHFETIVEAISYYHGNAVPFTLQFTNEEGQNIFGEEPQKIIFDNDKNYFIMPIDFPAEEGECLACMVDISKSTALYNYYSEKSSKIEDMPLIITDNAAVTARLIEDLQQLPQNLRKDLWKIKIVPDDKIEEACEQPFSIGCTRSSREIILPEHYDFSTLYHEAAHTKVYAIEQVQGSARKEWTIENIELLQAHNQEFINAMSEEEKIAYMELNELKYQEEQETFESRWEAIAGNVYGKDLQEEALAIRWTDGTEEPRNGCMKPYGCNNLHEDVATHLETFGKRDYGLFKELIDPTNAKYDPRYKQKLDLLYEYEFITEEQYNQSIGARP